MQFWSNLIIIWRDVEDYSLLIIQTARQQDAGENLITWKIVAEKCDFIFSCLFHVLFLTQGEFWRGPLLGQVWFHSGSSLCRRGSGGGWSGDPDHDVSTSYAFGLKEPRDLGSTLTHQGHGFFQGTLYQNISISGVMFSHLENGNIYACT